MKRIKIAEILRGSKMGESVSVKGWVRAFRSNRFIQLNDGSTIKNVQAVVDYENYDESLICLLYTSPSPRDLSTSRMPSSA